MKKNSKILQAKKHMYLNKKIYIDIFFNEYFIKINAKF